MKAAWRSLFYDSEKRSVQPSAEKEQSLKFKAVHRHTAAERNPEQYVERKCERSNRTDTTNDLEVKKQPVCCGAMAN